MNFDDIFKSSFLEKTTSFSLIDTLIAFVLAFILGLFIYTIYKKTYKGVMYSSAFATSLLAMTCITTLIILAVTSNVILSLGMVGALSIVRFRTAVKESMDICFIFWSISVGIVLGAGLIPLAVLGSLFIGITMIIFLNKHERVNPYLCILQIVDSECEVMAIDHIKNSVKKQLLKAKNMNSDGIELTLEIQLRNEDASFIKSLMAMQGIKNVSLLSYNGEYMS